MECQKTTKKVTVMHEAEEMSTSSANDHGPETKETRVKIPRMNIPEFAESIISVEVLAERVKQSSLGKGGQAIKSWCTWIWNQAIKSWRRGSSNQVLAMKVQAIKSWRIESSNQVLAERAK